MIFKGLVDQLGALKIKYFFMFVSIIIKYPIVYFYLISGAPYLVCGSYSKTILYIQLYKTNVIIKKKSLILAFLDDFGTISWIQLMTIATIVLMVV